MIGCVQWVYNMQALKVGVRVHRFLARRSEVAWNAKAANLVGTELVGLTAPGQPLEPRRSRTSTLVILKTFWYAHIVFR